MADLKGVYVATTTAFDANGDFDAGLFRAHLDRLLEAGADGIVLCGGTGEFAYLSDDERREEPAKPSCGAHNCDGCCDGDRCLDGDATNQVTLRATAYRLHAFTAHTKHLARLRTFRDLQHGLTD